MEHPLITTNPGIEGGKPIIKGTRITVEMLADEYAVGGTIARSPCRFALNLGETACIRRPGKNECWIPLAGFA